MNNCMPDTAKRYFVTGGTGFIGTRLITQLRAAGHDVVALVRNPAKAQVSAEEAPRGAWTLLAFANHRPLLVGLSLVMPLALGV